MEMKPEINGTEMILHFKGSLDTDTSEQFEDFLNTSIDGIKRLILDFAELEYITSAGLRAVFVAEQIFSELQGLVIRNANKDVYEIFDITGSTNILAFEK